MVADGLRRLPSRFPPIGFCLQFNFYKSTIGQLARRCTIVSTYMLKQTSNLHDIHCPLGTRAIQSKEQKPWRTRTFVIVVFCGAGH